MGGGCEAGEVEALGKDPWVMGCEPHPLHILVPSVTLEVRRWQKARALPWGRCQGSKEPGVGPHGPDSLGPTEIFRGDRAGNIVEVPLIQLEKEKGEAG